ncbi:MAG: ankyrin repeat domain-containing protein [Legionellales bacterium]|nr:ankyrin repeat domain-containing protein [Legionellales bacterium]
MPKTTSVIDDMRDISPGSGLLSVIRTKDEGWIVLEHVREGKFMLTVCFLDTNRPQRVITKDYEPSIRKTDLFRYLSITDCELCSFPLDDKKIDLLHAKIQTSAALVSEFPNNSLIWVQEQLCPLFVNPNILYDEVFYVRSERGNTNNSLLEAAKSGDLMKAQQALLLGADINTRSPSLRLGWLTSPSETYRSSGMTPLMCAAKEGHGEMVKYLCLKQADITLQCNHQTALDLAMKGKHDDITLFLKDKKAPSAHPDEVVAIVFGPSIDTHLSYQLAPLAAMMNTLDQKIVQFSRSNQGSAEVSVKLLKSKIVTATKDFIGGHLTATLFQENCKAAIRDAGIVLNEHRGWGEKGGLLSRLTAFISHLAAHLFGKKTDSAIKLDHMNQIVGEIGSKKV